MYKGETPKLSRKKASLPMFFSCGRFAPKAESLSIFNISGIGSVCQTSFNVFIVCFAVCPSILFTSPCFSGRTYLQERKLIRLSEPLRYFGPMKSMHIMLLPNLVRVYSGYFMYLLRPFFFFTGLFTSPASFNTQSTKDFETRFPVWFS